MNETKENVTVPEQELSELLQIRRDKLTALQEAGRDPLLAFRDLHKEKKAYGGSQS